MNANRTHALGLVRFPLENLGTEIWLVSNPAEVREAFEESDGGESPLDDAARVAKDCVVLRAHWGNDIPPAPDGGWLARLLAASGDDADEVEELVARWRER